MDTPAGNVGGSRSGLVIYTRTSSSEPAYYTITGLKYPTLMMYAIANTNQRVPSVDKIAFNTGATLATPALSGLSTSTDLLLGIYDFGSTFALANLTQTGSLIYDPPSAQTGYPGQCVGFWGGHLPLSGTAVAGQGATYPATINWAAVAIAILG
jgi:hypothetical protein